MVPTSLLKALRTECDRVAKDMGIASSTLASRSALENISRNRPGTLEEIVECGPLMRWQARLLEPGVREILEG